MKNLRLAYIFIFVMLGCRMNENTDKNTFYKYKFSVNDLRYTFCVDLSDCCFESNRLKWSPKGISLNNNLEIGVYKSHCKKVQGLGNLKNNIDSIIDFKLNMSPNLDRVLVDYSDDISIYKLNEYITSKISKNNSIDGVALYIQMPNDVIEHDFTTYLREMNKNNRFNVKTIKIINYFIVVDSISNY